AYCYGAHLLLHPFPTRRSSDLPSALVVRTTDTPVWTLVSVTFASRTIPPDASRTVPTTEAVSNCADARGIPKTSTPSRQSRLARSEEHTSELQSRENLVCRLLL